ncbi:MAG: hypothetical protein NTU51_09510 [Bacteroidetes bacterium]|nr:hypothetical protein [Bacteroidota bacterium]
MKILNSDIISFIYRSSEKQGFKALKFLLQQPSNPLPFLIDTSKRPGFNKNFSFTGSKGIYCWDATNQMFIKKKDTSLIIIRFPMPGQANQECRFFLYEFETGKTRTRPEFPVKIRAKLYIGNREEFSLSHQARISETMIASICTKIKSDSTDISLTLNREGSFAVKRGNLNINLRVLEAGKEIMVSAIKMEIDYHPPISYSINHIRIEQNLFSTELSGKINYGKINPTSNEYNEEFNKNTDLKLLNSDDRDIIGNIILSPSGVDGRFDYFIRFSDGSESRLKDQLMVLQNLLKI